MTNTWYTKRNEARYAQKFFVYLYFK